MNEVDATVDANDMRITVNALELLIGRLKPLFPHVPLSEWLIISNGTQFRCFTNLWEREAPDILVEDKEMAVKIPVEIQYSGIRWITDDSVREDVIRIEVGKQGCGMIERLSYNGEK